MRNFMVVALSRHIDAIISEKLACSTLGVKYNKYVGIQETKTPVI